LFAAAAQLVQLSPLGHVPPAVWDATLRLNTTANYRLIRSLDPLLRAAPAGRALFVTDRNNRNRAYWNAYDASKAALEAAVLSYAGELTKTAVRVNLAAPAPFASRLRTAGFPGENPASLRKPEAVAAALLPLLLPDCQRQGEIVEV
ncbi:MAG TPA: SDR family NAD(P)-dependent oxidoreductase, partial [Kiloniellales bacterium]|nr:SDR family NAD(P)-dependent oxidoreductase [Kiloniellales bacterium]